MASISIKNFTYKLFYTLEKDKKYPDSWKKGTKEAMESFATMLKVAENNSKEANTLAASVKIQEQLDKSMAPFDRYTATEQELILIMHTVHRNMLSDEQDTKKGREKLGLSDRNKAIFFVTECQRLGIDIGDDMSNRLLQICKDHVFTDISRHSKDQSSEDGKKTTLQYKDFIEKTAEALKPLNLSREDSPLEFSDPGYAKSLIEKLVPAEEVAEATPEEAPTPVAEEVKEEKPVVAEEKPAEEAPAEEVPVVEEKPVEEASAEEAVEEIPAPVEEPVEIKIEISTSNSDPGIIARIFKAAIEKFMELVNDGLGGIGATYTFVVSFLPPYKTTENQEEAVTLVGDDSETSEVE